MLLGVAMLMPEAPAPSEAAQALQQYIEDGGLTEGEKLVRLTAIQAAAQAEGIGDIAVTSFIRNETLGNQEKLDRVARRLGLIARRE